jgi:hypothetical protein
MIDEVAPALTRLGARETVATLHEALKRTGSGYFESLAGALADLGDPGPIERALAGSARSEREAAARYLCAKGDRRGAPVLLAMNSGIYLDLLNAVRSPGAWKALAETPLRSSLAGNRTRLFERICRVAARKSNLAVGSEYESALWWQEKEFSGAWQESISVQEALMNILERGPRCGQAADAPEFNVILEADEIRIIPGADACAFWKQWWADEQTKTKK